MKPIQHALPLLFVTPTILLMASVAVGAVNDYSTHNTLAGVGAAVQGDLAIASQQISLQC